MTFVRNTPTLDTMTNRFNRGHIFFVVSMTFLTLT
jgi:hypothetical protein